MNLRDLDYLRSVITHASFTRAAQAHGVSQAAISLAMQRLEGALGFALFERQGFRKSPTERARLVASASAGIAESVRKLPRLTGRTQAGAADRLLVRAGLAPAAGLLYGAAMYRALRHGAPGQMLSVITGPAPVMLEQLQRGELDLVIAPQPRRFAPKDLERHVMYIGDPVIYARLGHPLQKATTLSDVADAEWVVAGAAGTPGNVIEEAFRVRRWGAPRIAVQCPDYRMMLRLISGSDLLGVISNASLVPLDERPAVRPLSIREGLPRYDVCLFWSANASAARNIGTTIVVNALIGHASAPRAR